MFKIGDIARPESESGVIATLIHKPEFVFFSEELLPNHFSDDDNKCLYAAISELARNGITTIDPYNILQILDTESFARMTSGNITVDRLNELMDMSDVLARNSVEEYKLLVDNVLDASFRREMCRVLNDGVKLCCDLTKENAEQQIYNLVDSVMTEYSTIKSDIPEFKDIVDACWEEIQSRQKGGYAGTPFKFPALNEFATIEPGELFIFAAEAKQGKSMMLLNCAVDLLRRDQAVLYIDSELNSRLFTARMLSHLTGIEYKRLTSGLYDEAGKQQILDALAWIKTRKFTHIYIPMFDMQSIYTTVKRVYHTQGIDTLIVDYFKGSGDGDAFDSYQELGRFVDIVKNRIAGDMGISAIGAAQATVNGKVADSAKIGRNASTIAMLQDKTPEEIAMDGPECGNKKLRVVLNRNGMQMAQGEYIDLFFDGNRVLYEQAKQHVPVTPY